ncbi:MAG: HyaD/HybD family hydrogenase maturation endopeptidase [Pseudomonadota bacterium]
MRIVVLGIGNILLSDEGVGVRAIEALREQWLLPAEVEVIDGGTSGMELLEDLSRADLLVVTDAVKAGRPPGSIVRIAGGDVPVFFRAKLSPHQVGLSDVLADLEFLGEPPRETVIFGVQPLSLETRLGLSPEVAACVPKVVEMIVDELRARGIAIRSRAHATVH